MLTCARHTCTPHVVCIRDTIFGSVTSSHTHTHRQAISMQCNVSECAVCCSMAVGTTTHTQSEHTRSRSVWVWPSNGNQLKKNTTRLRSFALRVYVKHKSIYYFVQRQPFLFCLNWFSGGSLDVFWFCVRFVLFVCAFAWSTAPVQFSLFWVEEEKKKKSVK